MRRRRFLFPAVLALAFGGLALAQGAPLIQRIFTGPVTINGDLTGTGTGDFASLKADSLQTHTGGATALNIGTTGSGNVTVGNSSAGITFPTILTTVNGLLTVGGSASLAQSSSCNAVVSGAATGNPVTFSTSSSLGSNCGITLSGTGSGAYSLGNSGTGATTIGNATGGVTLSGTTTAGYVKSTTEHLLTSLELNVAAAAATYGGTKLPANAFTVTALTGYVSGVSGAGAGNTTWRVSDGTNNCDCNFPCAGGAGVGSNATGVLRCTPTGTCAFAASSSLTIAVQTAGCTTTQPTIQNIDVKGNWQ